VHQGDSSTYQATKINLIWDAPQDIGCVEAIDDYSLEALIGGDWVNVGTSNSTVSDADLSA
jgi:hypothetical protein